MFEIEEGKYYTMDKVLSGNIGGVPRLAVKVLKIYPYWCLCETVGLSENYKITAMKQSFHKEFKDRKEAEEWQRSNIYTSELEICA